MGKCRVCKGMGMLFTPRVLQCAACKGGGGTMDREWAEDTITRFGALLRAHDDPMDAIGGANDLFEWAEGLHKAGQFLLMISAEGDKRPYRSKAGHFDDELLDALQEFLCDVVNDPDADIHITLDSVRLLRALEAWPKDKAEAVKILQDQIGRRQRERKEQSG